MNRLPVLLLVALVLGTQLACRSRTGGSGPGTSVSEARTAPNVAAASAQGRPVFVQAPELTNGAQGFIREQLVASAAAGERILIYVGASWCEPCERFHHAVDQGEFDAMLAGTRLLEFDADLHTAALGTAGYSWRMIPVIAVPNADGQGALRMLSGSIKGPDAVQKNLRPRLQALLDGHEVK